MKTKKKTESIATQLFLQKWRKQGESERKFLLTPKECAKKRLTHSLRDASAALMIVFAAVCILATVMNNFILDGSLRASVLFMGGAFLFAGIFCFLKPGKLGELTSRMYYDWRDVSKGLARHNLLYQEDSVDEYSFAKLVEAKLQQYVEEVHRTENREEEKKKAFFKRRLSNLFFICSKLDLDLPEYKDLYRRPIFVRLPNRSCSVTIVIPREVSAS